jgi:hypothetical protein
MNVGRQAHHATACPLASQAFNQLGYKLSVHSSTMAATAFVLRTLSLP